jgi:hypothetical protein
LKRTIKLKLKLEPGSTWTGTVIAHGVAFLGCVIVPVLITLMAPVTVLEFRKSGPETSVIDRKVLKDTKENRRKDQVGHVQLATGQVAIMSAGPNVIVQAQPGLAEEISAGFEAFAASPDQGPIRKTIYASWALTYGLGGAMTSLFVLYVIGVIFVGLNAVRRRFVK